MAVGGRALGALGNAAARVASTGSAGAVDAGVGSGCWFCAWRVVICSWMLLLAVAGVGELVCVLERAGELLAGGGVLAQGGVAVCLEAVGELGQGGGAMLELAHERQAGVGELGALERRWRGREAVERELDDRAAVGAGGDLGVDGQAGELADRDALPVGELLQPARRAAARRRCGR